MALYLPSFKNMLQIFCHPKTVLFINRAIWLLIVSNVLSLFAAHHWFFDLFVNFKIQYLAGSVFLFALCIGYKRFYNAGLMGILAIGLFVQIQMTYTKPWQMHGPDVTANFKIAQYNKLYFNDNYDGIGQWLRDPANDFDVVIINESRPETIEPLQAFKDVLPYQFPATQDERFGDISILSKYPITVTPLIMPIMERMHAGSKIIVQKPGLEPVALYAYHAQVPIGGKAAARRNEEMRMMADFVHDSKDRNVILMGDWNLTPWSPHFQDVLKRSGLNYQNYGLIPQVTWPSFALLPFLKIPIDHVLFNDKLTLVSIRRGPSNGSDHHSLVAAFSVTPAGY